MGMDWDHETLTALIDDWLRWGLVQPSDFLRPSTSPRGADVVSARPGGAT